MARASYQDEIQSAKSQGREEEQQDKQQKIAHQILEQGELIEKIRLYTGLSEKEIGQLSG